MSYLIREGFKADIRGVPARFTPATKGKAPGTFRAQTAVLSRAHPDDPKNLTVTARLRFDDECGNGHNSFSITGEIRDRRERRDDGVVSCGCIHEDIGKAFPELSDLIQWHLCGSDGPMHYVANTLYLAGDRDHRGKRAGEPYAWQTAIVFGDNPIQHGVTNAFWDFLKAAAPAFDLEVIRIDHDQKGKPGVYQFGPKFTFGGFGKRWHECPFDDESEAVNFLAALQRCNPTFTEFPTLYSEGKPRDLDADRRAAIWPDATDAELMEDREVLKAKLEARLPALIERFRAAMEGIGFLWEAPATVND